MLSVNMENVGPSQHVQNVNFCYLLLISSCTSLHIALWFCGSVYSFFFICMYYFSVYLIVASNSFSSAVISMFSQLAVV